MLSTVDLHLDLAFRYISSWQRFRQFTTLDTLRRELQLSEAEARSFVNACCNLGLGTRRNCTSIRLGGIVWNRREVEELRKGCKNAA